jgi:hypothetical protein
MFGYAPSEEEKAAMQEQAVATAVSDGRFVVALIHAPISQLVCACTC